MKAMTRFQFQNEPDFQTACQWWSDLPNIWTPLGWRDHLCRFNVLWNGSVLAQPSLNRRTAHWAGQGLQLSVAPHYTERYYDWSAASLHQDDGAVRQGWSRDDAPVLWTEWARDGLLTRSEMFAHVPGGGEVERGDEPLFLWMRLRIHDLCPVLPAEPEYGFILLLQAPHVDTTMSMRSNIYFHFDKAAYPRALRMDPNAQNQSRGCRVLEPDDRVRIGIAPGRSRGRIALIQPEDPQAEQFPMWRQPRLYLRVMLPARRQAFADVLVPMVPCEREIFDRELKLGFDAARRETRRFWRRTMQTPTRFETPEPAINDCLRQSVRFSLNLTEKNPATGKYCKVNGSWVYTDLWSTPGAMDLIMLLDGLGYHGAVARYLEVFKEEQGTVVPPGDAYPAHPGYLSTPAAYKSIDWLSDNGALLWTICQHALLSGDMPFARRFIDCIVKSCDWIKTMRARSGHGGYAGVLPPAVATDAETRIQAVWSIGWNHLGLRAAVRVLKRLEHPRAEEFALEAEAYRKDYAAAFRAKCRGMPTWKDTRGRRRRFTPTALCGDTPAESRHPFYLDTGPLFNVFSRLLRADDPLMQDTLAWFREGPQRRFHRLDSNCGQVPVLNHEISSCEPCYSWNVFFSWETGDRVKFLEGMYSLFAGSLSRRTRISCETRGGVTGTVFSAALAAYLARLAVIDDELEDDVLHLLRLMPLAWITPGASCRFEAIPTIYGPVTLTTRRTRDGRRLDIRFRGAFRRGQAPARVMLHIPEAAGLKTVALNGTPVKGRGIIPAQT